MSCELTDAGRAFSTVLTAFIGSIVNGLTSGFLVAFATAWISWFAVIRVLSGASYGLYQSFSKDYKPLPTNDDTAEGTVRGTSALVGDKIKTLQAKQRRTTDITYLGWIGWVYTAIYSPIIQILWLAANWSHASGQLKLVRGLGIAVTALGLTIDTKRRYAERLGGIYGVVFKLVNGGSAFGMGAMCLALLIKGAIDLSLEWYLILIYSIFSVIWAAGSFALVPVADGGIRGFGIIPDILIGVFGGVFLAAPAFAVLQTASFESHESGSASLNEYLSCESVAVWRKMAAVLP